MGPEAHLNDRAKVEQSIGERAHHRDNRAHREPSMSDTNRSNRYAASCGPAAASGWYCTEKLVSAPSASRSSSPSTTSSLRQTWLTDASPNSVVVELSSGASTAK